MSAIISQEKLDNFVTNLNAYHCYQVDYFMELKKTGSVYLPEKEAEVKIVTVLKKTLTGYDISSETLSDDILQGIFSTLSGITGLAI